MSDGITHEMIAAQRRKDELIEALATHLDRKIAQAAQVPQIDSGTLLQLQATHPKGFGR